MESIEIEICFGPECSDCGGRQLAEDLKKRGLGIIMGDCRSQCPNAPLVLVNRRMIVNATVDKVLTRIEEISAENQ